MLLKYIVANFKSIGHSVEFSMFPLEESTDARYLTSIDTRLGKWNVLKRGALFGPNASGKSSFIESIDFARDFIVEGQKSGRRIRINQFKGKLPDIGSESSFQFMFYLDGDVYDYGFAIDRMKVSEEWLMILTETGFELVFERKTDQNDKTKIEITSLLAAEGSKERVLAEILTESIKENQVNQLFLYKLADNGVERAEKLFRWFSNIQVIFPESKLNMLEMQVLKNRDLADFLSNMLNKYDTGVKKILAESTQVKLKEILKKMDIPEEIIEDIYDKKNGMVEIQGKLFLFNDDNGEPTLCELKLKHMLAGEAFQLDKEEESDGTQRLLDLLPILFKMANKKQIFFIDELDRSLHTRLTKQFLTEFDKQSEGSFNQMIFTAHDVNLINLKDMRQEEIWLIDKNQWGETSLKPFSDYDIREDIDTVKAYLAGRFGAVPQIMDKE